MPVAAGLTSCTSLQDNNHISYSLGYVTVGQKSATQCGGFSWTIKWTLNPLPYNDYGIVAQIVQYSGSYYECGSSENKFDQIIGGNKYITEYWIVQGLSISSGGMDTFSLGIHKCSKGELTINASATFFAEANLPASALPPDTNKPTGTLPYSPKIEHPSGTPSNTVNRTVHASWDCLDGKMHNTNVIGG